MRSDVAGRLRASLRMTPAVAHVAVRSARRRLRATHHRSPSTWQAQTRHGLLRTRPVPGARVRLDGADVGRFSCRIDGGTSTAECESTVAEHVVPALIDLAVSGLGADVRRIAWFVPEGDASLEAALGAAGFVSEGWAPPPLGDVRPHWRWALLTGRP
jgi:hypothetical protein